MLLSNRSFLDSLYNFAYKRTNGSFEAEDLCSEIIVMVLAAARKNSEIYNPKAFIWTIARRVYADFAEKRSRYAKSTYNYRRVNSAFLGNDPIDEYIEIENDRMQFRRIMREICFLSKIYRDVCIMYYLDEMTITEISKRLGNITENAVKQRLHSARKTIKSGVEKVDNINLGFLTVKPIDMVFLGWSSVVGVEYDPEITAERRFSKNLLYLCKDTERSVKELSEMLNVPMIFVEEEVEVQVKGVGGYYGLLKKTDNGKYISNFIIVDYSDYMKTCEIYKKYVDIIAKRFVDYLGTDEQKILNKPFINKQTDVRYVAWAILKRAVHAFSKRLESVFINKYYPEVVQTRREVYKFGIALKDGQNFGATLYCSPGGRGFDIGGYKYVFMNSIDGRRVQSPFYDKQNVLQHAGVLLTIRSIGGLAVSSLNDEDREVAARAIEYGLVKKEEDMLYPKILIGATHDVGKNIFNDFIVKINDLLEPIADELYSLIKKSAPRHMASEYKLFASMTALGMMDGLIEKCIELGALIPPKNAPSTEGMFLIVSNEKFV